MGRVVFSVRHGVIVPASGRQVANLRPPALGTQLNVTTQEHADFSGVKVEGPFNCGHYRFRAARLSRGCCRVEVESKLCDAHVRLSTCLW